MKKEQIKEGVIVRDSWWLNWGIGVKKTVFEVWFGDTVRKYDYAHAKFLEKA